MMKNLLITITLCFYCTVSIGQNKKAVEALEDQRFHDAIAILDKNIESGKSNDDNKYIYAISSFFAGKYEESIKISTELVQKYPANDDFKYWLIKNYSALKQYDIAKDIWATLSEKSKTELEFVQLKNSIVSQAKWDRIVNDLEVSNFDEINTSASDFSPQLYGEDIVFCTLNKADLINIEQLDPKEKNFSKLYKKKLGQFESSNSLAFFPGLIHGKHIGPIAIDEKKFRNILHK